MPRYDLAEVHGYHIIWLLAHFKRKTAGWIRPVKKPLPLQQRPRTVAVPVPVRDSAARVALGGWTEIIR